MLKFLKDSVSTVKQHISEKLSTKKNFPIKRMANLFGGALLAVTAYTHTAEAQENHVQMSAPVANHVFYHNNTPGATDGNEALLAVHRVQTGGLAIDTRQMTNTGSRNGFIRRDVHTLQESGRLVAFIRDKAGNEWQLPVSESGLAYMPPSHPALANTLNESGTIQAQDIMVGTLENGTAHIIATAFQGTQTTSIAEVEITPEKAVEVETVSAPEPVEPQQVETINKSTEAVLPTESITEVVEAKEVEPIQVEHPNVAPSTNQAPPAALIPSRTQTPKEEAPASPWLPFGVGTMAAAVGAYMYKRYKKVTKVIDRVSNVPALLPYTPQEVAETPKDTLPQGIRVPAAPQPTATAEEIMDLQELYEETKNPAVAEELIKAFNSRFGLENTYSLDIAETIIGFRGYVKIDPSSMYYRNLVSTLDLAGRNQQGKKNEVFWLHASALESLKIKTEWNRIAQSRLLQKLWSLSETNTLPVLQRSKLEELMDLRNAHAGRKATVAA